LARAFGALGLETGVATERVFAFGESLELLKGIAPELVAIGAALVAVSSAFNFLHDGIEDAAKMQDAMATLAQAVKNQGGAWNDATENGVERFLEAIERATIFSRGEAVEALNRLVNSGLSLQSAMKTVAIETDVASGAHMRLSEVTEQLLEAENGRALELERLDPKIKELIKSHADLSQILEELARHFSGDATAAANTYDGRMTRLDHTIGDIGLELGEHFLPMLSGAAQALIGIADEAERHEPQIISFFDKLITGAQTAARVISDAAALISAGYAGMVGDVQGMLDRGPAAQRALGDLGNWLGGAAINVTTLGQGLPTGAAPPPNAPDQSPFGDLVQRALANAKKEQAAALAALTSAKTSAWTGYDPTMGNAHTGGGGAGRGAGAAEEPFQPISDDDIGKMTSFEAAAKALDEYIKALTEHETSLREAVDLTTNAHDKAAAKTALLAQESKDGADAEQRLAAAHREQVTELAQLESAQRAAQEADNKALAALNSYGTSAGHNAQKLKELEDAHTKAKKALDEATTSVDKMRTTMDATTAAYDKARKQALETAEANAEMASALNDAAAANKRKVADEEATYGQSIDAQIAYYTRQMSLLNQHNSADIAIYNSYADKIAELQIKAWEDPRIAAAQEAADRQKLADEEATYGKSLQQQIAYYTQRYALTTGSDQNDIEEHKRYLEQILSLEEDAYKQRIDAEKTFRTNLESAEDKILDDLIAKHESFRSVLKAIWQDIEANELKSLEATLTGPNGLLGGFNALLGGIFAPAGKGNDPATQTATYTKQTADNTATLVQQLSGGIGGAAGSGSGFDLASAASLYGLTGIGAGAAGGAYLMSRLDTTSITSLFAGTAAAQDATNSGGMNGAEAMGGAWGNYGGATSTGLSAGAKSTAGIIGGAAQLLASLEPSSSMSGASQFIEMIGGAVANANPLLGAGIDAFGAILGLFGNKTNNPQDQPDNFESQTGYGQDIANLQFGQAGADGKYYYPDAATAAFVAAMGVAPGSINQGANQGMQAVNSNGTIASSGGIDAAEIWLAQNAKDTAAQLEAMGVSPAQFQAWVQQLGESATGSGQFSHIPGDSNIGDIMVTGATTGGGTKSTYSQLAADLAAIEQAAGGTSLTPTFQITSALPGGPSVLSGQTGLYNQQTGTDTPNVAGATGSSTAVTGSTTVNVTVQGSVVSADDLATVISQSMYKAANGQIIGSPTQLRKIRISTGVT
jgi:hypothetical protein